MLCKRSQTFWVLQWIILCVVHSRAGEPLPHINLLNIKRQWENAPHQTAQGPQSSNLPCWQWRGLPASQLLPGFSLGGHPQSQPRSRNSGHSQSGGNQGQWRASQPPLLFQEMPETQNLSRLNSQFGKFCQDTSLSYAICSRQQKDLKWFSLYLNTVSTGMKCCY